MTTSAIAASTRLKGLDHINIKISDMEPTIRFLQDVFGLVPGTPPGADPAQVRWMYDENGAPLFHLNARPPGAPEAGRSTGPIDHVALACSGHGAMCERLDALGLDYELNDFPQVGLRQIFVRDPNGILLELNFHKGDQ